MPTVPTLHIDTGGTLAVLATSSWVAASSCSTVLATVTLHGPSSSSALTVSYSERSHAAGRIPSTPSRCDNQQPGESETLGLRGCSLTTACPSAPRPLPRRPPSLPRERRPRCTLADKEWDVLLASGAGCVRVALFKDERRGGWGGGAM